VAKSAQSQLCDFVDWRLTYLRVFESFEKFFVFLVDLVVNVAGFDGADDGKEHG
jgi:hypothetical protein